MVKTKPILCACGCGKPVRDGREFRMGHDMKLRSDLYAAIDAGDKAARGKVLARNWPLPSNTPSAVRRRRAARLNPSVRKLDHAALRALAGP